MLEPYHHRVTFGDCDPAQIVFYPNTFRWMDAAFHTLLRPLGGHALLCKKLDAIGLGLVDASAQFKRPMRDGDALEIRPELTDFSAKSITLEYKGYVQGGLAFVGKEVRCQFVKGDDGITAADISTLRAMLEQL